jgi:hypothetical protein
MKLKYLLYDNTGWFGIQITKILRNNRIMYYIGKSSTDINLINKEIDDIKPTHIVAFRKINIDLDETKYKRTNINKNISVFHII